MDQSPPPILKMLVFLLLFLLFLVSTNSGDQSGNSTVTAVVHDLHCVNDFVSTVSCSLSVVSPENTTDNSSYYWLLFKWPGEDGKYVCMMSKANGNYSCSFDVNRDVHNEDDKEVFVDTEVFEIQLCHALSDGDEHCSLLDEVYELGKNIKPKPPCCLTVCNSSQYHFSWKICYPEYVPPNKFNFLMYQLHYYQRGGREDDGGVVGNKKVTLLSTDNMNLSVDAHHFLSDTEYVVAVRSSPNQNFFQGQWSDWSPEVHWRTETDETDSAHTIVSGMDMRVIIPLCVAVPLFLLLCLAPAKKWKRTAFIPTPAPYFQTLYSEYQGDFKSWVVTPEKRAGVLPAEETLQIDDLTECEEVHEEDHPLQHHYKVMKGSLYSNMSDRSSSTSLLGLPYAVSTTATFLASGSLLKSQTPSSGPGSPAGDSGCWLSSDWSFEKDAPWYNNEYCTLNTFQKSHMDAAEQHGSSFDQTMDHRDYQNEYLQEAQIDI